MSETVTIPKADYDRLRALEEDFADIQAGLAVEARLAAGEEELIPAAVVDRLLDGEPPLTGVEGVPQSDPVRSRSCQRCQPGTDRGHRGRSQQPVSVLTLRKLADALEVTVDDLIPSADHDTE